MQSLKARLAAHMMLLVGLFAPAVFLPFTPWFLGVFQYISHSPIWGSLALGALCLVASVLPVPTALFVLANGFMLGVFLGSIVSIIGTTVGACVDFLLARLVGRRWAAGRIAAGGRLAVLDRAVGEQGFKIVLLTRLSPVAPFISLNYIFGLTRVSFRQYAWGTLVGGAPGTILYVFLGAGLHSLHEVIAYAGGERGNTTRDQVFFWASLIVTVVVSIWLTRVARRALRDAIPKEPVAEPEQMVGEDRLARK